MSLGSVRNRLQDCLARLRRRMRLKRLRQQRWERDHWADVQVW
jgi:hypothetical protein